MSAFVLARSGRCVKKAFTSSYFAMRSRPRFSLGNLFARAKARKVSGFTPKTSRQLSCVIVTGTEGVRGAGMIEASTSREMVKVISSPGPLSKRIVIARLAAYAEPGRCRDQWVGQLVFDAPCGGVSRSRGPCPREHARAIADVVDLGTSWPATLPVCSFR